jgi:hypothetical protein
MAFEGTLKNHSPSEVLNTISLSQRTGTLSIFAISSKRLRKLDTSELGAIENPIASGKESIQIAFEQGKIIYAAMSHDEMRVLDALQATGKISDRQAETIRNSAHKKTDKAIAMRLITSHFVEQNDILHAIENLTKETLHNFVDWFDGFFRFEDHILPDSNVIRVKLDVKETLKEIHRRQQFNTLLTEKVKDLDTIVRFTTDAKEKLRGANLSAHEWKILGEIDGKKTIRDLAVGAEMNEFEIRRAILSLRTGGYIRLGTFERIERQPSQ